MPFNEKGEIIRPKNREKTRSDIQRSVLSDADAEEIFGSFWLPIFASFFSPGLLDEVFRGDYWWSVFHWSGCLLSIVLFMWLRYCCKQQWWVYPGDELGGSIPLVVLGIIINFVFWPTFLLTLVILLLTYYFHSFMKVVANVVAVCSVIIIILCVAAFFIGLIIYNS